jgi:hypothetical protein
MVLDHGQEDIYNLVAAPGDIYYTKSAYLIQFKGRTTWMKLCQIWKAKADPKYRFFARLSCIRRY